jgi:hypothetical protein
MGKILFVLAERLRINRMNPVNILILVDTRQYWTITGATTAINAIADTQHMKSGVNAMKG